MSTDTEIVLQNHLTAARAGVEAIMRDYAEDSVLVTQEAAYHGLGEIRRFFTALLDDLPPEVFNRFKLHRCEVVGEWAYILWDAKPWVERATDTFAVRDGRIRFQTFTTRMGPQELLSCARSLQSARGRRRGRRRLFSRLRTATGQPIVK